MESYLDVLLDRKKPYNFQFFFYISQKKVRKSRGSFKYLTGSVKQPSRCQRIAAAVIKHCGYNNYSDK